MLVITDSKALETFAKALAERPFVAVDTEFMRERTYWPILCLVQAAADGLEAIIDPVADGMDLTPLLEVLADRKIIKVFHAARQDVEIFHQLMGAVPAPLFDSQIAAMACGFGDQIGYEPLMRGLLGASVDKGSRFTDWARRPLSTAQLEYALSDVTHLRDAYPILVGALEKQERRHWVEEEMAGLLDPRLYKVEPEDAWTRMKLKGARPGDLGPLIKIAEWREREAQMRNMPRGRILKDEAIYELARLKPKTPEEMGRARAVPAGFERSKAAREILDAVAAGLQVKKADLPRIERGERGAPAPADVVELLKVLLKRQCEHLHVAPKLVASAADIEAIALDDEADAPALHGWRREVYGALALKLKHGEIGLKLTRGAVEIVTFES